VELVFGVLADKDLTGMLLALRPAVRRLHVTAPASPRARPAAEVEALARSLGMEAHAHGSLQEALACAQRAAADGALVTIAGSLYVVGEARGVLGAL
jgi:dihydrofolate synthase/folylpolyglutamate synthase